MGNMKLPLSKDRSMLKGEVGWVRAWLGGAWRLEVLRQSCDQRHVFQLEWVKVGREGYLYLAELAEHNYNVDI